MGLDGCIDFKRRLAYIYYLGINFSFAAEASIYYGNNCMDTQLCLEKTVNWVAFLKCDFEGLYSFSDGRLLGSSSSSSIQWSQN